MTDQSKVNKVKTYEPDMLIKGEWYALTMNGADQTFNFPYMKSMKRLRKSVAAYSSIFKYLEEYAEYRMLPEISSPMDHEGQTRIHYHGIIRFRSDEKLYEWYTHGWNTFKRDCSVKIKVIKCFDSWENYYEKNKTFMIGFMKSRNLPYDLTDGHRHVKYRGE